MHLYLLLNIFAHSKFECSGSHLNTTLNCHFIQVLNTERGYAQGELARMLDWGEGVIIEDVGWVKNIIEDVGWVKNIMGKMEHKCT